jgi:outer membrane lipoprotein-sorting protein
MSRLLWSGIAIAFIGLIGTAQAQIPPDSKNPTPQSQPVSPTSTSLKATDLPLLKRAIGKFWQTNTVETESQIEIDSSDEKGKSKYFISVKTIAKVERKFRSELNINRVGQTSKTKYTIVCDGDKAWIYRPDVRQYIEIDSHYFGREPSASIVGLSSFLFTSIDEKERQDLIADISGEDSRMVSIENFKLLQLSQQQIDSRNLSLYTYGDRDDNPDVKLSGFVYPQTAMLERTEIKFRDRDKYTKIVEKIVKRNPEVAIDSRTFIFSPPKGSKKVKSLQVGLFKF